MTSRPYLDLLRAVLSMIGNELKKRGIPVWVPVVALFILVAACDWNAKRGGGMSEVSRGCQTALIEAALREYPESRVTIKSFKFTKQGEVQTGYSDNRGNVRLSISGRQFDTTFFCLYDHKESEVEAIETGN